MLFAPKTRLVKPSSIARGVSIGKPMRLAIRCAALRHLPNAFRNGGRFIKNVIACRVRGMLPCKRFTLFVLRCQGAQKPGLRLTDPVDPIGADLKPRARLTQL